MVDQIINAVSNIQLTISGINSAFSDVPTSIANTPCFINYPLEGGIDWPRKIGQRRIEHKIAMDLYVQKGGDLSAADRLLKPFLDLVIETFDQNITLQGTVLSAGVTHYKYGTLSYAGVDYIGIRFELTAIELTQVVYKG